MDLTFSKIESYISRLPIDSGTYRVFEALLGQPYDVFRPVMDMLFDGTIVVEDLMAPPGTSISSSVALVADTEAARSKLEYASVDIDRIAERCVELATGRSIQPMAAIPRDQTAVTAEESGRRGSLYAPEILAVIGTDANAYAPNPIEIARAGSPEAARKVAQENFIAAVQPKNE